MSGHQRGTDQAEVASVNVADYLLERDRLSPKEPDVIDEISERHLCESDLRAIIDALINYRRDVKIARQARFRTRVDHDHTLMSSVVTTDYHEAVCNCGITARVVDKNAAEVWHALYVRWPTESAAELATRMRSSLRDPDHVTTLTT